jgi:hypothetical protein
VGYSRLVCVLAGNYFPIGLGFGKVIRSSAALVCKEDAVEGVGTHLTPIDKHDMSYAFWNSVSYAGLRNLRNRQRHPIAIL